MGILRFNYRSEALTHYVDITVVLPTDNYHYVSGIHAYDPTHTSDIHHQKAIFQSGMKYQTVYLIHGGGDDDTLTYRYSNIEEIAQRNHVMLVTPNVSNSFGIDTKYNVPYMTFITDELPAVIQSLFPSSPDREDNFIMGYAMGGNVALGCAINRPDVYLSCVDISGGIGMTLCAETLMEELDGEHFQNYFPLYNASFGASSAVPGSKADLRAQVLLHRSLQDAECSFILICGSKELIRCRVENDVATMQELNMDVSYICAEGYDHNFILWNRYMQLALDYLLPLKRQAICLN